jgi:hypothetical protein
VLRVASLNDLVAYGFLNLHDGSYDLLNRHTGVGPSDERFVSVTVHEQIRLLAAEGLEPAESYVFSEIDDLNKIVGANKHFRIIAGICLLRLMLMYRDRLVRNHIRMGLPRGGRRKSPYRRTGLVLTLNRTSNTHRKICIHV